MRGGTIVPIRSSVVTGIALAVMAVFVAGCMEPAPPPEGDGGDGTGSGNGIALMFRDHPDLGPILTDAQGLTLYIFTNDEPGTSNCYDQCATNWPPLTVNGTVEGPASINGELGTVERTDGSMQAGYQDRPLYYFQGDQAPGDANGDGLGGVWFVVREPPSNPEVMNGQGSVGVSSDEVEYVDGTMGYYAAPTEGGQAGVVMVHEWWGLNDNIRNMADLLASHGYRVLAVDLFDGSVAQDQGEAQAQVAALDQSEANQNMRAAAAYLRDQGVTRVASLGWCFGGGQSLQLAISGETLSATVIYYGFLVDDEQQLSAIDWPVLGVFGEDDQAISVSSVRSFEAALENLSIENDIYVYPDVGHAFANPSGDSWSAAQSQDAWARTLMFLEEHAA